MNRTTLAAALALSLAALTATGCTKPAPEESTGTGDAPLYYENVAAILNESCVSCHVAGGIAPMALDTYEAAAAWSSRIAARTADRSMPPYAADNSGDCNTFEEARWLTDAQIDVLQRWNTALAPKGDPANAPPAPEQLPPIRADAVAAMQTAYTPRKTDDLRCFVVDPQITGTKFLTGFKAEIGEARVVHHIILFAVGSAGEAAAIALDGQNDTDGVNHPGYECPGSANVPGSYWIGAFTPGSTGSRYPAGTGIKLAPGRKMVMQMHYNTETAGALPDLTKANLQLETSVAKPGAIYTFGYTDAQGLPPNDPNVAVTKEIQIPGNAPAFNVYGLAPHMHKTGTAAYAELDRAGQKSCMIDAPRYDFGWQQFYFYEEPVQMQGGDTFRFTCGYNTSGIDAPVQWGEGTADEMCIMLLYLTQGG